MRPLILLDILALGSLVQKDQSSQINSKWCDVISMINEEHEFQEYVEFVPKRYGNAS